MTRDVIAYIDIAALQHNFNYLKKLTGHCSVLAMIKSNAYGHGLLRIAKKLNQADAFGVACIDEALVLRNANVTTPLIIMSGFNDQSELKIFSQHNLTPVIHNSEQLQMLAKVSLDNPLPAWLKIDTGMNRLGFRPDQVDDVYQHLVKLSSVAKPLGLMTHLADANNKISTFTEKQIHDFLQCVDKYSAPKSIVNSAGILSYQKAYVDWVRPGIMLYGVSPLDDRSGLDEGLRPVMTLKAKLIAIRKVKKNSTIGYGCTWRCPEDMLIGVVAAGYGDGYPRHAPSQTPTLISGKTCPLVGRVSMDLLTVDLRASPNAKVGDEVTLWGDGLPVEKIASLAGTIGYELLCSITSRVRFIETGDANE